MANKTKTMNIPNETLRDSFLPRYIFRNKDEAKTKHLIFDSSYGLHWGIENKITNGLGYGPIRESNKKVKTIEDLYSHLGDMEDKIEKRCASSRNYMILGLVNHIDSLVKEREMIIKDLEDCYEFCQSINKKTEEIYEALKVA